MIKNLFVYGTLAPNRPNAHVLAKYAGTWTPATVTGHLHQEGWGAQLGFPGIVLDAAGVAVQGFVFTSDELERALPELDAFEGDGYQRVRTQATLSNGAFVEAYIYALNTAD